MDLGFMPSYLGFKYFLVVIDAYTEKLWAVALKKNGPIVGRALEQIINSISSPISVIQSDMGKLLINIYYFGEEDFA
jgi:hypothetical protein